MNKEIPKNLFSQNEEEIIKVLTKELENSIKESKGKNSLHYIGTLSNMIYDFIVQDMSKKDIIITFFIMFAYALYKTDYFKYFEEAFTNKKEKIDKKEMN